MVADKFDLRLMLLDLFFVSMIILGHVRAAARLCRARFAVQLIDKVSSGSHTAP